MMRHGLIFAVGLLVAWAAHVVAPTDPGPTAHVTVPATCQPGEACAR